MACFVKVIVRRVVFMVPVTVQMDLAFAEQGLRAVNVKHVSTENMGMTVRINVLLGVNPKVVINQMAFARASQSSMGTNVKVVFLEPMVNFAILCVPKGARMELAADKVALVSVYQGLLAVCVMNVSAENTAKAARNHAQMVAIWVSAIKLVGTAHA